MILLMQSYSVESNDSKKSKYNYLSEGLNKLLYYRGLVVMR